MNYTAEYFITQLGLAPHMEGGYFKELYKHDCMVGGGEAASGAEQRCLSSTIYYLLKSRQVSRFHRLRSDEIWFYHAGSPLRIYMIDAQGVLTVARLGLAVAHGEKPQITVPAGTVFGADVVEEDSFTLVSCMVSPGFDYKDFALYTHQELMAQYPEHGAVIARLYGPP